MNVKNKNMIITRDEFVKLLDTNKIKHMEIQIEITSEFSEREEDFILDKENGYLNSKIISESCDLLEIRLKTRVNHNSVILMCQKVKQLKIFQK